MITLIIECEGAAPARVELPSGEYSLGTDPQNAIVIDHPTVSRHHCDLVIQANGQVSVRDAGSTNGTWLENEPVNQAVLRHGQSFRAGAARITLGEALPIPLPPALPNGTYSSASIETRPESQPAPSPPSVSFFQEFTGALLYPFRGEAYLYIVIVAGLGAVQVLIPDITGLIGLFIGLVIGCYVARLWQQIVLSTINGKEQMPDFLHGGMDWREDFSFYLHLMVLSGFCFSPVFFFHYARMWDLALPPATLYLCYAFGYLYFPMALLGFLMFDSLAVLNPLFIVRSIFRKISDYLLLAALLAFFLGSVSLLSGVFEPTVPARPALTSRVLIAIFSALSGAIGLYASFVWMRLLGLFYRHNQDSLGWS